MAELDGFFGSGQLTRLVCLSKQRQPSPFSRQCPPVQPIPIAIRQFSGRNGVSSKQGDSESLSGQRACASRSRTPLQGEIEAEA